MLEANYSDADGRYDNLQGDPDYVASQERDGDGVACEANEPEVSAKWRLGQ